MSTGVIKVLAVGRAVMMHTLVVFVTLRKLLIMQTLEAQQIQ